MSRRKGIDTRFVIKGSKYDTSPLYYSWDSKQHYPYYKEIEEREFIPEGITSLNEGELWLLKNYPEYYFGAGIYEEYITEPLEEEKEQLDFCALAVPSYYEQLFETTDRQYIINELIKNKEKELNKEYNTEEEKEF